PYRRCEIASEVVERAGGVVVVVHQRRCPRAVPVRSWYHDRLLRAAGTAGHRLLIGGTSVSRQNVTTPITACPPGAPGVVLQRNRDPGPIVVTPAPLATPGILRVWPR
ncbi:MAG: hypothetical protein M0Z95_10755, partial [Actinomycetota bacterium]|nr:hypothetical protein [Actinomycetota bacterium]